MDAEELLNEYVNKYLFMLSRNGVRDRRVREQYLKLKDLILVEIYFMKNVRIIVTDDEMSGFILYIDRFLQNITESYKPYHGSFLNYLSRIMELRALTYMGDVLKCKRITGSYTRNYLPYVESVVEGGADKAIDRMEERDREEQARRRAMGRLRYFCAKRPKRRRSLFVFLCTQMPNLSVDTIDVFCEALNCDKDQTFAIADFLYENTTFSEKKGSRIFLEQRRDHYWTKLLETEAKARRSTDKEAYRKKLCFHREKFITESENLKNASQHVPYSLIGELLNMDRVRVSSEVYWAKEILELAMAESIQPCDGPMGILANMPDEVMHNFKISKFEPFRVFKIRLIHLNKARCNSVATCLREARANMKC